MVGPHKQASKNAHVCAPYSHASVRLTCLFEGRHSFTRLLYMYIYPPELELKKTTESHDSCSYLDLNISILNGKFCTDLYDKRDTFSFSIVNFPHMDSNIPSKPAYGVVISQLVRYLRICCNYEDFAYRSKLLTTRLLRQGYIYQKLCRTYKTLVHRYPETLQKYRRCLKNFITECIASPTV